MRSPTPPHRILQYDYARGECVRPEYIRRLLRAASQMGYTALSLYCEDLSMFEHPPTHPGTLSLKILRELDREAKDLGVILWPFLASYGHVERTLRHARYRHLAEHGSSGTFCVELPATRRLLQRVYECLAENFRCPFIHIGFDETWEAGNRRRHQNPATAPSRVECYLGSLHWAVACVERTGRRAMFWADFIGYYYPSLIHRLPKNAVLADWIYEPRRHWPTAQRYTQAGYEVMLCPSTGSGWTDSLFPCIQPFHDNLVWAGTQSRELQTLGYVATSWAQGLERFDHHLPHAAAGVAAALGRDPVEAFRRWLPKGWTMKDYQEMDRLAQAWPQHMRLRFIPRSATLMPSALKALSRRCPDLRPMIRKIRRTKPHDLDIGGRLEFLARFAGQKVSLRNDWLDEQAVAWGTERAPDRFETEIAVPFRKLLGAAEQPIRIEKRRAPLSPLRFSRAHAAAFNVKAGGRPKEPTRMRLRWKKEGLEVCLACLQKRRVVANEDSSDLALTFDDFVEIVWAAADDLERGVWMLIHPSGRWFLEGWGTTQFRTDPRSMIGLPLVMDTGVARARRGWGFTATLPWLLLGHPPPKRGMMWRFGIRRYHVGIGHSGWGMTSVWIGSGERDFPDLCRLIGRR